MVGRVGSQEWGIMPSPLHAVECKGVATLFLFEQRAVQDHGVAPLFRTCPGTKEATSKARQRQQPQPSRTPPTMGVYVACVPVRRACSCNCRLLQRGPHDAACLLVSCLLVLVLHACSCLCRILPRGTWPTRPQPMGLMALTHRGKTATWVLPSTVFPGWAQHWDRGDDRL
jgi:hypothetical protein